MKLGELLQKAQINYHNHQADSLEVQGLVTDSRLVQPGDLFIGMPGTKVNGGIYAQEVLAKGAIAALVSQGFSQDHAQIITVSDIVSACAQVAAVFFDYPGQAMPLVGVTGTNGKTTTTHLIEFLSHAQYSPALFGTLYSRWQGHSQVAANTTPFAVALQAQLRQALDAGANLGILEVSSHALDQKRVWCCPFKVAVFTNLTQDHLDYHLDLESYFQAKALLFSPDYLQGKAVINLDDAHGRRLIDQCQAPVWSYSLSCAEADIYATDLSYQRDGIRAMLHTPAGKMLLKTSLVGNFNLANIMAAIASCLELGISLEQIETRLPQFVNVPGRVERVEVGAEQDITVVVDYAHTPDSLENILRALRPFTTRELICVFGCGGDRDKTKRPIMGQIAQQLSDRVYITSDNPRTENPEHILQEIASGIVNAVNISLEPDRSLAIERAICQAQPGDTVVIAGKGHEDYQIVGSTKIYFDDREQARQALGKRLSRLQD